MSKLKISSFIGNNFFNKFLILFIISIFLITFLAGIFSLPNEDAAITYNYSQNLAESGRISYIFGGERAEGATDFIWMIFIAILQKLGIPNHLASSILNIFFLILFGLRILSIGLNINSDFKFRNSLVGFSLFLFLIYFTGVSISGLGGFATLAQISFLAILFLSFIFERFDKLFVLASFIFILLRPDSIVYYLALALPFLIYNFFEKIRIIKSKHFKIQNKKIKQYKLGYFLNFENFKLVFGKTIEIFIPIFIFIIYWLLRAIYFQNFFPLPYYVKKGYSDTFISISYRFVRDLLSNGYNNISISIIIFIAFILISNLTRLQKKTLNVIDKKNIEKNIHEFYLNKNFWFRAFFIWFFFYISQSLYLSRFHLQQNVWDRFHAPLLAISAAMFSSFLLIYFDNLSTSFKRNNLSIFLICALFLSSLNVSVNGGYMELKKIGIGYKYLFTSSSNDNVYSLSLDLRDLHRKKNIGKMFVTEAGRLTYYSRIPSIDTWGLNTPKYAINPLQDPSEIGKGNPDLINIKTSLPWMVEAYEKALDKKDLNVGRRCTSPGSGEPPSVCGARPSHQAIFIGAKNLSYNIYLVPILKDISNGKYHLWLVNPNSPSETEISKVLKKNGAIEIRYVKDLLNYAW